MTAASAKKRVEHDAAQAAPLDVTLDERRRDVEERLVGLFERRGIALVDGKDFDNSEITAAEQELAGLADAQAEEHRRRAAAEAQEAQERRAGLQKTLAEVETARFDAINRVEVASKTLAAAIADAEREAEREGKTIRALGRSPAVRGLMTQRDRLSASVGAALRTGAGNREWGLLNFGDAGSMQLRTDKPWSEQLAIPAGELK